MKKYILSLAISLSFSILGAENYLPRLKYDEIVLPLNDSEKVVLRLYDSFDEADHLTYMLMFLVLGDTTFFLLGEENLLLICERLKNNLVFNLVTDIELHESVINIGDQFNEWAQQRPVSIVDVDGDMIWPGFLHNIFLSRLAGWLYVTNQEIVFELTHIYQNTFVDSYDVWVKKINNPFFKRVISRDTAEQWLAKIENIIDLIHSNIARNQSHAIS